MEKQQQQNSRWLRLDQEYGKEKFFAKSNRKKKRRHSFFLKFIRSASSVHPEKTDRHPGLTKSKHEFYPYAIWENNIDFDKDAPKGYDVKLVYLNSKPTCYCSLVQWERFSTTMSMGFSLSDIPFVSFVGCISLIRSKRKARSEWATSTVLGHVSKMTAYKAKDGWQRKYALTSKKKTIFRNLDYDEKKIDGFLKDELSKSI